MSYADLKSYPKIDIMTASNSRPEIDISPVKDFMLSDLKNIWLKVRIRNTYYGVYLRNSFYAKENKLISCLQIANIQTRNPGSKQFWNLLAEIIKIANKDLTINEVLNPRLKASLSKRGFPLMADGMSFLIKDYSSPIVYTS